MPSRTDIVEAHLADGTRLFIEATHLGGEANVGRKDLSFDGVVETIGEIAKALKQTLEEAKPRKASLELGIDVGVEAGQLTALLVKGTGSANLKVTLEWGE
jgi:hypothetical protein